MTAACSGFVWWLFKSRNAKLKTAKPERLVVAAFLEPGAMGKKNDIIAYPSRWVPTASAPMDLSTLNRACVVRQVSLVFPQMPRTLDECDPGS